MTSRETIEAHENSKLENEQLVHDLKDLKEEYANKTRILTTQDVINKIVFETVDLDEMLRRTLD